MWNCGQHTLSDSTGRERPVSVVFPATLPPKPTVVFCADGQVVESFCNRLAASGPRRLPVLVGVHSDRTARAQEYLYNGNSEYLVLEEFFVQTLRSWVSHQYGIPVERSNSVISGFSNGGAFALTAALRHPRCFSGAFCFSTPKLPERPGIDCEAPRPNIYLAAGNVGPERSIRRNVLRIARWLRQNAVPVTLTERNAGHTLDFWASEFPLAIAWFEEINT